MDTIMDQLAESAEEAELALPWKLIDRQKLYAHFGVLINMGIIIEWAINNYWGDLELAGVGHVVKNYI